MNRTTIKELEMLVKRINILTNSPLTSYTKDESGHIEANLGNFHLDGAYGGWKLMRLCTKGGGVEEITHSGYTTKSNLYKELRALITGLELKSGKYYATWEQ